MYSFIGKMMRKQVTGKQFRRRGTVIPMAIRSVGLEKKLQAVMEQAVENCDVAGVNLLVEKEG